MSHVLAEAQKLSRTFGKKTVLHDVSLTLHGGTITGFVGANGAGKTTALRLMLGLLPGQGTTLFCGRPLSAWKAPAAIVGSVFGGVAGHPRHSVRAHLCMVAAGAGHTDRRADDLIDLIGMREAARTSLAKLSLGMAQRVGIAQAMIANPRILILDEPANGLDPHSIHWLRDFLRARADEGCAVLVSSHLLAEMEQFADRVAVLSKGRIVSEGPMRDLLSYADSRSAITVETPQMTELAAIVQAHGGRLQINPDHTGRITGIPRRKVGHLAADNSIVLYQLSENATTLEDFYLTIAEEEYRAR
ncbi:ABC transporter ATP-binding protein [Streptomyces dangxiongensis]|uniref:ABC transporter ATP-binding protein n=1 Tax=Streptomyces dangxiongensis TaxID=1442032 RepID=A0A3G2JH47_9ACTN|nr:ABC transporter ATP-binding protein [Streptomyces dangxiongensis]AYN41614.1 ABC transporter ATP-binding protein [Streptomyces dangxiongensis]